MFIKFAASVAACAAVFSLSSCDSDSNTSSTPGAPATMAGSSFSFNPTVELTDGTNFNYVNTDAGSTLAAGPISGTYTFTRNSDTQATIVLNGTDIGGTGTDTLTLILSNFAGSASSITQFDVTVDSSTFQATVVAGTIVSAPTTPTTPTAGGSGGSIPDDPDATPATIDPGFVGTHELTYHEAAPSGPFTELEQVTFEITAAGELKFQGRTLTAPFFFAGNTFEVIWFDGTYSYAASGSGSINEINIGEGFDYYTTGAFTFLGQFNDVTEAY